MKKITALIITAFVLCSFAFAADTFKDSWIRSHIDSLSNFPDFGKNQPEIYASFERALGIIYSVFYSDGENIPLSPDADLPSEFDAVIINSAYTMEMRQGVVWDVETAEDFLDMDIYIFDPVPFYRWDSVGKQWEVVTETPLFLANPTQFPNDAYYPKFVGKQADSSTGKNYINKYTVRLPLGAKVAAGATKDFGFHLYYVDQGRPALRWPSADEQVIRVKGK